MWAVDTSWLYALFFEEDAHHSAARRQAQDPGVLLLNPVVLAELVEMVRRRTDRPTSLKVMEDLLRLPHVRIVAAPKPGSWARAFEKGGVSWHDASAICTALDEGAGLRTFDKNQQKAFQAMA